MKRRHFIEQSILASTAAMVPRFLSSPIPKDSQSTSGKNLIVVQFSGGNDGLNTVVPYGDDIYRSARPRLSLPADLILPLTDYIGLHPALSALQGMYDQGDLLIINGVGYPNPNRSHFRSMEIWQTASNTEEYLSTGWLGRYLDHDCHGCDLPYHALEIGDNLGIALQGASRDGFAMRDGNHLRRLNDNKFINQLSHRSADRVSEDHELGYLYKTMIEVQQSAEYLIRQSKVKTSRQEFPTHPFGRGMKLISELITAETDAHIYYISLPGFDTHANQYARHEKLLSIYAQGVSALVRDLKEHRLFDETLIMTFSEFGRRVEENGSMGTDHGTANNMFLMGGGLARQGIFNDMPSLSNLDNGDLLYSLDFRRVYATILEKWLEVSPDVSLTRAFESLDFL